MCVSYSVGRKKQFFLITGLLCSLNSLLVLLWPWQTQRGDGERKWISEAVVFFGFGSYGDVARGKAVAVVVECNRDSGKEVKQKERPDIKQ